MNKLALRDTVNERPIYFKLPLPNFDVDQLTRKENQALSQKLQLSTLLKKV